MIKKRFPNYKKFSQVETIKELTGFAAKDILEIKKVNTTSSLALMKKDGKYIAEKLPQEAQYSNIRDFYWDQEKTFFMWVMHKNLSQK